jgi:hypothetical protein
MGFWNFLERHTKVKLTEHLKKAGMANMVTTVEQDSLEYFKHAPLVWMPNLIPLTVAF